ncbi:hypothetical protein BDQ12DRAFT_660835 [Crucibulum laeve]|uniref:Uncharacterized protein n=1 Tax=Crucibulum laeve TaxID=68775 RepID=A0A5C3MI15_9AGAR|nr:hypothetical protein BDQ12DRAFT_660835 [Crucibulum laeve]
MYAPSILFLPLFSFFFSVGRAQTVTLYAVNLGDAPVASAAVTAISTAAATVTTIISAIGTGSDGFTTYVEQHVPITTAPDPSQTSSTVSLASFNLGGLGLPSILTYAQAASGIKSVQFLSAEDVISEELSCTFASPAPGASAACVDVIERIVPSTTEAATATIPGRLVPFHTFIASSSNQNASFSQSTSSPSSQSNSAHVGSSVTVSRIGIPILMVFLGLMIWF